MKEVMAEVTLCTWYLGGRTGEGREHVSGAEAIVGRWQVMMPYDLHSLGEAERCQAKALAEQHLGCLRLHSHGSLCGKGCSAQV